MFRSRQERTLRRMRKLLRARGFTPASSNEGWRLETWYGRPPANETHASVVLKPIVKGAEAAVSRKGPEGWAVVQRAYSAQRLADVLMGVAS